MNKIRFVRLYENWNTKWADVVYKSGRLRIYTQDEMPKTVRAFIASKEDSKIAQLDKFHGEETIYE